MKTGAIMIDRHGGPEVLKWREIEIPKPGRGQVLIRNTVVGFNFVDVYNRIGFYPVKGLPSGLGIEAAGVVEAIGPGVTGFKPGQRVAYTGGAVPGAYAEHCVRSTMGLARLPGWIDDRTAAAALSKGRTVQYLFNRTHKLRKGETILFHAAAGGVGLIACQWAKAIGAKVIGTVSTDDKARLAKRHGCTWPIVTSRQNFVDEVMRLTKGQGVDVVYDSIGKDTWEGSVDCVRRLGLVVSFGSASGAPENFDFARRGNEKSAFFTRCTTVNYMTSDDIIQKSTRHLFRMIKDGAVKIRIGQTYPLREAAQAHIDAEARKTTGSTLLLP